MTRLSFSPPAMIRWRLLASAILAVTLVRLVAAGVQVPAQESLAVTGITVIDVVGGRALPNQTVLIGGGRLTSFSASQ